MSVEQEDYNTNFLAMLEVWEAGERFCAEQHSGAIAPKVQILDIAALLGWTTIRAKEETRQGEIRANTTACVCHDASALIRAGHVTRHDLRDLSVYAVRELCGGLMTRLTVLERAKAERASEFALEHIEKAVEVVTKATRRVADYVRDNECTHLREPHPSQPTGALP